MDENKKKVLVATFCDNEDGTHGINVQINGCCVKEVLEMYSTITEAICDGLINEAEMPVDMAMSAMVTHFTAGLGGKDDEEADENISDFVN